MLGFKLAMVAGLVITAGLVTKLCRANNRATGGQAFGVGLLALVAPARRALELVHNTQEFVVVWPSFLAARVAWPST